MYIALHGRVNFIQFSRLAAVVGMVILWACHPCCDMDVGNSQGALPEQMVFDLSVILFQV